MLIGFLRRGRRVAMVPGSIGPKGPPEFVPVDFDLLTYDGQPVSYGNQRAMTQTLEIRYGR